MTHTNQTAPTPATLRAAHDAALATLRAAIAAVEKHDTPATRAAVRIAQAKRTAAWYTLRATLR